MDSRASDALARLRTCRDAGVTIPPDLHEELISVLAEALSAEERQSLRDREIRIAALLLPDRGANWAKAGHLWQEAQTLMRSRRHDGESPVRQQLREAARYAALPGSRKQYARILAATDEWTSMS